MIELGALLLMFAAVFQLFDGVQGVAGLWVGLSVAMILAGIVLLFAWARLYKG